MLLLLLHCKYWLESQNSHSHRLWTSGSTDYACIGTRSDAKRGVIWMSDSREFRSYKNTPQPKKSDVLQMPSFLEVMHCVASYVKYEHLRKHAANRCANRCACRQTLRTCTMFYSSFVPHTLLQTFIPCDSNANSNNESILLVWQSNTMILSPES